MRLLLLSDSETAPQLVDFHMLSGQTISCLSAHERLSRLQCVESEGLVVAAHDDIMRSVVFMVRRAQMSYRE